MPVTSTLPVEQKTRLPVEQNTPVPMRTNCRHYESRTYGSGEVVRKCRLDAAPEAPWRCPEHCLMFEVRMMDAGWQVGTLEQPAQAPEPEPAGQEISALLDEAEDIVNSAAPDILAEFEAGESKGRFRRKKKRK